MDIALEEEEEEDEEEDDLFSTKGFDPDDIQDILEVQEQDPFKDIILLKREAVMQGDRKNFFRDAKQLLVSVPNIVDDTANQSRRGLVKRKFVKYFCTHLVAI